MCFYFKCNSSLFYAVCREGIEMLHNWENVSCFTFVTDPWDLIGTLSWRSAVLLGKINFILYLFVTYGSNVMLICFSKNLFL
jgi:hypothetical protein